MYDNRVSGRIAECLGRNFAQRRDSTRSEGTRQSRRGAPPPFPQRGLEEESLLGMFLEGVIRFLIWRLYEKK